MQKVLFGAKNVILALFVISTVNVFASDVDTYYTVSMPKPINHLFEVEITIPHSGYSKDDYVDFKLPVWRSGRYVVFNFASGVQEFSAAGTNGSELKWFKVDKSTWRVVTTGAGGVTVKYKVFANEFSDRTKGLDNEHAFIDASAVFMYTEHFRTYPLELKVIPYGNWHVTTGLDYADGKENTLSAPSYDYLADCPIEIGNQKDFNFTVEGKRHTLSIEGEGNYNADTLIKDLTKIVEVNIEFWGELPYDHFDFIFQLTAGDYGGTEHWNSFVIDAPPNVFESKNRYAGFLSTCSHEFFHTWNVKRLRPHGICPYDFTKENYTEELWIAEGTTSYYQQLMLLKAGYGYDTNFIKDLENNIDNDENRPGNKIQTLAESSFDAWVKFWVNTPNKWIAESDYYSKGANVSVLLDLEIRNHSGNEHSLDDVMRAMYERFPIKNGGYVNSDFIKVSEEYAGESLTSFFDSYLYGLAPIDWDKYLSYAGLKLIITKTPHISIGVSGYDMNGNMMISYVQPGSPAEDAGLESGDAIDSLNGVKVNSSTISGRMKDLKEGDNVRISFIKNGSEKNVSLSVKNIPIIDYRIEKVDNPTELQKTIYESWLNRKW